MSSLPGVRKGIVGVIGDEFFTLTFRLGGARKYYVVRGNASKSEISKIIEDTRKSNVTLLIVQESLKDLFKDAEIPPHMLLIFIPDLRSRPKFNIKEFYISLIRKYLGVSIVLG